MLREPTGAELIRSILGRSMGVDDGRMGTFFDDDLDDVIAARKRALARKRKQRATIERVNAPDEGACPEGMQQYVVTYQCGHPRTFMLKQGFSDEELAEVYGKKQCPTCAVEIAAEHETFGENTGSAAYLLRAMPREERAY